MNLKRLLKLKAASGKSGPRTITFSHSLGAFCGPKGSKTYASCESGTGAYAAGYALSGSGFMIYNMMDDGVKKYPIPLNGAAKLSFDVPEGYKATVFFLDSTTEGTNTCAAWVDGDNNAYDSSVDNGPREVTVPTGADSFVFSIYYKNHTLTDEDIAAVKVTAE